MEPEDLADALKRLTDWAEEHAPEPEPAVRKRLREHFGRDPSELPIVSRALASWDRPNFQVAIDAWSAGRAVEVVGLPVVQGYRAGLAELVRRSEWIATLELGAVEHMTVPLGEHESVTCVESGFWLVRDGEGPVVVMLKSEDHGMGESLGLEVMAVERGRGERVLGELWSVMRERNVYRGRVLELRSRHFHGDEEAPLTVRTLPSISRDRIVLPVGVLERVERRDRRARRAAAGEWAAPQARAAAPRPAGHGQDADRHVPRGGDARPYDGAAHRAEPRAVGPSVDLATALQPAMVILEDVDLVAMDRSHQPTNAILFELLNAMDGLDEDHDILFVLTTNRADLLEPALAARPGRIDQAVELPLPDAEGRRRLLELYGKGLGLSLTGGEPLIADLEGVSPAFIRGLLRRAALLAAEESDGALRVGANHLEDALQELRQGAADLTNTLLGAPPR